MRRSSKSATMSDPASLIFKDNRPADAVGVHAVVIGVGHYAHLPGGSSHRFADHEGMVQLSSPPRSAEHIAKWLLDTYHDDQSMPLRSMHMLVSKKGAAQKFHHKHCPESEIASATLGNIKKAARDWFRRSDENAQNLLLFYFCGHGISAGMQHTLLSTDFGEDTLAPFENAVNFTDFHLGMGRCKAQSQVYFVDACRSISKNLIEQSASFGDSLIPGVTPIVQKTAPVFLSAQPGEKAMGLPREPSAFAQALPLAFKGGAWDKVDGEWVVCTSMLRRALERQTRRVMRAFPNFNFEVGGYADATITIKRPEGEPVVPVDLGGRPDTDHNLLELAYEPDGTNAQVIKEVNNDEVWLIDLTEGDYEFSAKFQNAAGQQKVVTLRKFVSPQNVSERLRLS